MSHVSTIACPAEVPTRAGKFRADDLVKRLPKRAGQKLYEGAGAKGHRFYDWPVLDLTEPWPGRHQLLIHRNRTTGDLAHAFLAVVPAEEHVRSPAPDHRIPLTCNEIQRLFVALVMQPSRTRPIGQAIAAW